MLSGDTAFDRVLNCVTNLGIKYDKPINISAKVVVKVTKTAIHRLKPFFSIKSTIGLKIIAIKIETISIASIDEKI